MSPAVLAAPGPPRSPWQLLYGAAHRARRAWWARRSRRLPRPVVSVGNLHWGGSGKTPLTAAVARWLRDQGRHPAILSRGYGRRERGVQVVSAGEGPLLGPLAAGDEPVALAAELPGVAVVVARDRDAAGRHALARLSPPPDVFVLDDGFSHLRLARDVDLLAFPAADPFAGGRLPPGGRLREPLAAAARADAVLLTGAAADLAAAGGGAALAAALAPHGFHGPGFDCELRQGAVRLEGSGELWPGDRVVAVAGVARPAGFFAAARELGFEITDRARLSRSPRLSRRERRAHRARLARARGPGRPDHRQGRGQAARPAAGAARRAAARRRARGAVLDLARGAAGETPLMRSPMAAASSSLPRAPTWQQSSM